MHQTLSKPLGGPRIQFSVASRCRESLSTESLLETIRVPAADYTVVTLQTGGGKSPKTIDFIRKTHLLESSTDKPHQVGKLSSFQILEFPNSALHSMRNSAL